MSARTKIFIDPVRVLAHFVHKGIGVGEIGHLTGVFIAEDYSVFDHFCFCRTKDLLEQRDDDRYYLKPLPEPKKRRVSESDSN